MDLMESIKNLIESSMKDASVEIFDMTGTKDHLGLRIISDEFEGKSILQQHKMVMNILKDEFKEKLHAVKIKTITKKAFEQL